MNSVYILIIINLIVGFGIAIPIARLLSEVNNMPERVIRYYAILILIYFVESVAIIIGMGIPVFSVILAFLWGIIWGLWFRSITSPRIALKTSFYMSLYSCLPSASFISFPFIIWIERGGRYILNVKEAINFGIPEFIPWPMNTILGFYVTIVFGAVVFKTVITTGEVSLLIHLKKNT